MSAYWLRRRAIINGSSRLPTELLDAIVSFVYGKEELYQLSRSSKLLRSIANPRLYQLYFSRSDLSRTHILNLLQHPYFEVIVNTITISLATRGSCRRTSPSGPPCACDKLDRKLGRALRDLLRLKTLRLNCWLCPVESQERHRWLLTLKTRTLQEFKFHCHCLPWETATEKAIEYFKAPCMASVTRLSYQGREPWLFRQIISKPCSLEKTILPKLQHLHYGDQAIHQLLLRHHPFTRLNGYLPKFTMTSQEDLWNTQGLLTHIGLYLYQSDYDRFLRAVIRDCAPFRNLQHIGTILLGSQTWVEYCEELYNTLNRLTGLSQLVSFDAASRLEEWTRCDEYVQIFQEKLSRLLVSFPDLRRAFLTSPSLGTDIWVLSKSWELKVKDCTLGNFDLISSSDLAPWEKELITYCESDDVDPFLLALVEEWLSSGEPYV
ncbi:hypothetical protein CPB86DRAFT_781668 [Serendipita vermifera]|nr:hypothetical protein CPB86DRAFT_781668 [Serendipita vermifera]